MQKQPLDSYSFGAGQIQLGPDGGYILAHDTRTSFVYIGKYELVELAQEIIRRYDVEPKRPNLPKP